MHSSKDITVSWLRKFRIQNIIKQYKGINAGPTGDYERDIDPGYWLSKDSLEGVIFLNEFIQLTRKWKKLKY